MKKKIAFLDRDGVINKKATPHKHITKVEEFIFNEGIFGLLQDLKKESFEFIIISNQRGVENGEMTLEDLDMVHNFMASELEKTGIVLLDAFYCPHQEGKCECRKPKPGLLIKAMKKYDIDLGKSIFIGDSESDRQVAAVYGIDFYRIQTNYPEEVNFKI